MNQHPLSSAFPAMPTDQFEALKDSISNIGVQNPITVFEGMVLDGWHRYAAANEVGAECPMVELGDVDPRDFVLAQNKARRHITQAQIALAATEVYRWQAPGDSRSAGPADRRQEDIAKQAGVSVRTLRQASKVREAAPAVRQAVRDGSIGLEKAAKISQLPHEKQPAAIGQPVPKPVMQEDEMAEAAHTISALAEEVEALKTQIAIGGLPSEEQSSAAEIIEGLRAEVKTLEAEAVALRSSRDHFQCEASELRKQIKMNEKELKKARAAA